MSSLCPLPESDDTLEWWWLQLQKYLWWSVLKMPPTLRLPGVKGGTTLFALWGPHFLSLKSLKEIPLIFSRYSYTVCTDELMILLQGYNVIILLRQWHSFEAPQWIVTWRRAFSPTHYHYYRTPNCAHHSCPTVFCSIKASWLYYMKKRECNTMMNMFLSHFSFHKLHLFSSLLLLHHPSWMKIS